MKKKITTCFVIALCTVMCSFVIYKGEKTSSFDPKAIASIKKNAVSEVKNGIVTVADDDADAWEKVYAFVEEKVVAPIQKAESKGKSKNNVEYFSRCPSGIEPSITSDSVKVNRFVYGKVNNWKGCKAKGICVFRVHVKNKIAQVREIGSKDFVTITEWIDKKYPKEIKG